MQKKIILRYIFWFLTLFVMVLIFYFSSQSGTQSSEASGNVTEFVAKVINTDYDELTQTEKQEILNSAAGVIRTSAHFFEYFLLNLFVTSALMTYNIKNLKIVIISALICVLYAVSDEIHQLFVSGRACEISDIIIDALGLSLGIVFIFLIIKIFKIKRIYSV